MGLILTPDYLNTGRDVEFGCFKYQRSFDSGSATGRYYRIATVTGGNNAQFKIDLIGLHQGYGSTDAMGAVCIYGELQNGNTNDNCQLGGYYLNQLPNIYTSRINAYAFDIYVSSPAFAGADILFTSDTCSADLYNNSYISSAPTGTVYNKTSNFKAL
jgi:hypothetical protein